MNSVLPMILYILGAILLVILIILGIKLIIVMNKVDNVVDDLTVKVNSLNGFFSIIDFTTDKLSLITDKFVDYSTALISKIFKKGKEDDEENE